MSDIATSDIATTRITHATRNTHSAALHRTWIWPLPRLDGVAPSILASTERRPGRMDIGYPDRLSSTERIPVFAAQDGVIVYASTAQGEPLICIDHAAGWATQYVALQQLLCRSTDRFRGRRRERVRAGDVVGYVQEPLRIGFSVSRLNSGEVATGELSAWMHTWSILPWFDPATPLARSMGAIS